MLRMFSRAQSAQVQTRLPSWIAGDHVNGGGTVGVGVAQCEQLGEWNRSFMPSRLGR